MHMSAWFAATNNIMYFSDRWMVATSWSELICYHRWWQPSRKGVGGHLFMMVCLNRKCRLVNCQRGFFVNSSDWVFASCSLLRLRTCESKCNTTVHWLVFNPIDLDVILIHLWILLFFEFVVHIIFFVLVCNWSSVNNLSVIIYL